MPFEDCALYLAVPDAIVLDPSDYVMFINLLKKLYEMCIRDSSYTIQAPGAVGGVPDVESVRQYIRKNRHLVENIAQ